jgi:hypothetical protein
MLQQILTKMLTIRRQVVDRLEQDNDPLRMQ